MELLLGPNYPLQLEEVGSSLHVSIPRSSVIAGLKGFYEAVPRKKH